MVRSGIGKIQERQNDENKLIHRERKKYEYFRGIPIKVQYSFCQSLDMPGNLTIKILLSKICL